MTGIPIGDPGLHRALLTLIWRARIVRSRARNAASDHFGIVTPTIENPAGTLPLSGAADLIVTVLQEKGLASRPRRGSALVELTAAGRAELLTLIGSRPAALQRVDR